MFCSPWLVKCKRAVSKVMRYPDDPSPEGWMIRDDRVSFVAAGGLPIFFAKYRLMTTFVMI